METKRVFFACLPTQTSWVLVSVPQRFNSASLPLQRGARLGEDPGRKDGCSPQTVDLSLV